MTNSPKILARSCRCRLCQVGCRTMPGVLSPRDLEHLPLAQLAASSGTATRVQTGERIQVRTIVPAQRPDGTCVFHDRGTCTVHDHKPAGCAIPVACAEPTLQEALELTIVYQNVNLSTEYQAAWEQLAQRGQVARPIAERQAAYRTEFTKQERRYAKRSRTNRP